LYDVTRSGRRDGAFDEIVRGHAVLQRSGQALQTLGIEAAVLQSAFDIGG
jgi:hypothetical protein